MHNMRHTTLWTFLLSSWIPFSLANPQIRPPSNPFLKRNLPNSSNPLEVDLGYAGYAGVYDVPNSLKYWYGIRYGQVPIGDLRWQISTPPETIFDGTFAIAATYPSQCPQGLCHLSTPEPIQPVGSEDCLFLNVWAPENATDLPVFVWIHGDGYGYGNAQFDMPFLLNATVNKYVIVDIQYRLGAYGFLAGDEVYKHGTTNAGLYDQYPALQWVQKYISLFGGDPDRVTIGGISAGLFLALNSATCADRTNFEDPFHCLVEQDTQVLMDANWNISYGAKYGEWAFLPVTDNKFVQQRPSEQLVKEQRERRRNVRLAKRHTEDDFVDFVHYLFPQFMDEQFEAVLAQYSIPADIPTVRFATDGLNKNATANFNLYAETTFDCPAYWMAEGFNMKDGQSYKYQVSIINSLHGEDETVYLNTFGSVNYLAPSFRDSFISMLDSFFTNGTPNNSSCYSSDVPADVATVLSSWPSYTVDGPCQAILNQTGGTLATSVDLGDAMHMRIILPTILSLAWLLF
ncbi:carboxylesterase [Talaromyces pinophilus]|uniref:Carboxylic ester hydrolase n=1 Tax=Talaromyces pinophilus TaxID=128442 RepID=A0A6V8HGF7_TALPI|nr:carboxylesterase [Talaromyces pinophilus]